MIDIEDVKIGVQFATLGSISILIASFLQNLEFISNYKGILFSPFTFYMIAGLLFLLTSSTYLFYWFGEKHGPKILSLIGGLSFFFGVILFLVATVFTLLIYFITNYKV